MPWSACCPLFNPMKYWYCIIKCNELLLTVVLKVCMYDFVHLHLNEHSCSQCSVGKMNKMIWTGFPTRGFTTKAYYTLFLCDHGKNTNARFSLVYLFWQYVCYFQGVRLFKPCEIGPEFMKQWETTIYWILVISFFLLLSQTCGINLEGQPFYAKGGKPYCKKHTR